MKQPIVTFGKRLKKLREDRQLTQQDLANFLHVGRPTIAGYETKDKEPGFQKLCVLAEYFNVSVDYLLGLTDIPNNSTANQASAPIYIETITSHNENRGTMINDCLFHSGYDPAEVAVKLGISEDLLDDIRSGLAVPTLEVVQKMSELFEVSTDYLLGLREQSRGKDMDGKIPFHFSGDTSARIKALISNYGMDDAYWADILSITEDEFMDLKEYGFTVHFDVLIKLADALHVSLDYLAGRTGATKTLGKNEEPLLLAYRNLNEENQSIAYGEVLKIKKDQEREEYMRTASVAADEPTRGTGTDGLGK